MTKDSTRYRLFKALLNNEESRCCVYPWGNEYMACMTPENVYHETNINKFLIIRLLQNTYQCGFLKRIPVVIHIGKEDKLSFAYLLTEKGQTWLDSVSEGLEYEV